MNLGNKEVCSDGAKPHASFILIYTEASVNLAATPQR
jgi:hypothetical protein